MLERRFLMGERAQIGLRAQGEGDDAGPPKIEGVAAVFYDGTPDTEYELPWGDSVERIMPGAFDRALKEKDDVRALFNHNPDWVLGRTTAGTLALSVDKVGLRYAADTPDTRMGLDVTTSIGRGDVSGSSFAFKVTDEDWSTEDEVDIREITGVRLFDVSPTTYPAYESTTTGLRAESPCDEARASWEKWQAEKTAAAKATADTLAGYNERADVCEASR